MEEKTVCPCCAGQKHTERTEEEKKKLLNRLSRIEGQVRGLRGMVERDAYCPDILTQASAVSAALDAFSRDLLARHVKTCVMRDLKNGDDSVADELVSTIEKMMR